MFYDTTVTPSARPPLGHPSYDSTNTSPRFAVRASNVCPVGERPTCSVLALHGRKGLWSDSLQPDALRSNIVGVRGSTV